MTEFLLASSPEKEALPLSEEIRAVRKGAVITQERADDLTGGGPRTFQTYEAGDLLPRRAVASAPALLDHDPAALRRPEQRRAARRMAPA